MCFCEWNGLLNEDYNCHVAISPNKLLFINQRHWWLVEIRFSSIFGCWIENKRGNISIFNLWLHIQQGGMYWFAFDTSDNGFCSAFLQNLHSIFSNSMLSDGYQLFKLTTCCVLDDTVSHRCVCVCVRDGAHRLPSEYILQTQWDLIIWMISGHLLFTPYIYNNSGGLS